jgi:hypothetical protein
MTATLRPMNLGEILDRSIQIYRNQFWAFVTVGSVPALVVQGVRLADAYGFHLYSSAVSDNHWTPGIYMTQGVFAIGFYHFESFFTFLMFPVILKLVSGQVLNEEIGIRAAWRFFGERWRRYLLLAALSLLAGLVIVETLTFALFGANMEGLEALGAESFLASDASLALAGLWFAAGFAVFLWVGSSLSFAVPSAAFENLKAFRALRRSWQLTRGSRLSIALAWVALAIASWMLSASFQWILRLVFILFVRATHARWAAYFLYPILSRILRTVLATLLVPVYPIAMTLIYYDQRIRLEGYDIERMMDSAGLTAPMNPPGGPEMIAPVEAGEMHA